MMPDCSTKYKILILLILTLSYFQDTMFKHCKLTDVQCCEMSTGNKREHAQSIRGALALVD